VAFGAKDFLNTLYTYGQRKILEGWTGSKNQREGMEKSFWEQGWIDPTFSCKVYMFYGTTKDSMGAIQKDTSIVYLACPTSQGFC
jgi:hypothetical protein